MLNLPVGTQFSRRDNYVGVINEQLENSAEGRVVLREAVFEQNEYDLSLHQHLIDFNYCETASYLVLFWPVLHD